MTQNEHSSGVPLTRRQIREMQQSAAPQTTPPEDDPQPRRETVPQPEAFATPRREEQRHLSREAPPPAAPVVSQRSEEPAAGPTAPARSEPAAEPVREVHGTLDDLDIGADEPPKKRRRRGGGCLIALFVVLAVLGGLVYAGYWAVNEYGGRVSNFLGLNQEPTEYEEGQATGEAIIVIRQGDTGYEISQTLYDEGVTLTPTSFYNMLVAAQTNPDFRPGVYRLQQRMTSIAALAAIEDPANREDGVAFPEGYTVENIIPILVDRLDLSEDEVQAAVENPSDYGVEAERLEGWLFPASYDFEPGTSASDAIRTMVARTTQALDDAGVPADFATRQEILTLASIIQREARIDDFDKVAAVMQNRLGPNSATNQLLQMDSTAQYGYGEMHAGTVWSSQEALEDDNPWNTYVRTGLPQTPISNPGADAIAAAMHPADGDWQFFVTVNMATGETVFSETLAEHDRAAEQARQWCRDNEGQC
ncbi:endolytic transglycosylase MltG [Microbacterium amylolyticum]|uniref:Endolytic murein transglycosylase n=1 Tax=Microbacterium amylolyticum TaxID=936337 RepID=A0ABS4ZE22_9MICO|nr:endolytic transglycosylase MltG [Microbacterium amylolyticum]MBP2435531.1 UPF0755 protein [Microbacterium amylolyticum]